MSNFKNNFAVVIGINEYENNIPELKTAVNDAKQIANILENEHKYKVLLLTDKQATYTELSNLLVSLRQQILPLSNGNKVQLNKDDRLLFYFAGHGIGLNADDGVERPEGLLVPQDANLNENKNLFSMQLLHDTLVSLHTRHLLIIFDCCFAGSFRWTGKNRHVRPRRQIVRERYERYLKGNAKQVITSTAHDEKATDQSRFGKRDEIEINGHSPFAQLLLDGLKGQADLTQDGVITTYELYSYLQSELVNNPTPTKQTPLVFTLAGHDIGDYIFWLASFDPNKLPKAIALDKNTNPYRGLKSFEKENKELFFGRNELIKNLAEIVETHPLTVVLGSSGSGKSSLVKAGLVPYLEKPENVTHPWNILLPLRLNNSPFKALDNLLKQRQGLPTTQLTQPPQPPQQKNFQVWDDILATLKIKQKNLTTPNVSNQVSKLAVKEIFDRLETELNILIQRNIGEKLLLVIDQFEELITQCLDDERFQFLKLLHDVLSKYQSQLRIVITLRSEFEPQFSETNLKPFWQDSARFQVTKMNREQLREIIEEPAAKQVIFFESPNLIDKLVDEAVNMPGGLSLLSFALSEQYLMYLKSETEGKRNDRTITEEDYKNLGGVTRSLIQTANKLYDELVNKDNSYEQIIRHVMLRMVTSSGAELARRRVLKSELKYLDTIQQQVDDVIQSFLDARLLVSDKDADDQPYVEPAHDELVLGWPKLRDWVKEEKNLRLQRRLTPAALEWKSKQQPRFLWNADPYLDVLHKDVLNSENNWLNKVETEFVQRSVAKKSFNTKRNWGIAISVMLGLSGLTIAALIGQRNALMGQIRSSRQASEANFVSNQQLDALINSLRAAKTLKEWPWYLSWFKPENQLPYLFKADNDIQPQLVKTLRKTVYDIKEHNRRQVDRDTVKGLFFKENNSPLILIKKINKTMHILNFLGKEENFILQDKNNICKNTILDGDGKPLASTGEINLEKDEERKFNSFNCELSAVIDFRKINIINKNDNIIKILDFKRLELSDNIFFNLNNQQVVTTAAEGSPTRLWNLSKNKRDLIVENDSKEIPGDVRSASFSFNSDRKLLATGTEEGLIRIFDLNSLEQKESYELVSESEIKGHQGRISNILFSPDSKQLITVSEEDGSIRLWNWQAKPLKRLWQLPGQIKSVSFSSSGEQFVILGRDGFIRLGDLQGNPLREISQIGNQTNSVSFSPDGKRLVTLGEDQTVRLWDLQGNFLKESEQIPKLQKHQRSSSFSYGGDRLAIIDEKNTESSWVRLLNLDKYKWDDSLEIPQSIVDGNDRLDIFLNQGKLLIAKALVGDAAKSEDLENILIFNKNNQKLADLPVRISSEGITIVRFSPDGSLLAAAESNGTLHLWDWEAQTLLSTFKAHQGHVNSISFSSDNSLLATAGEDGTAMLWQIGRFDELIVQGCNWVRDYLKNNPDVSESDRHLCDDFNQRNKSPVGGLQKEQATLSPTPMSPQEAVAGVAGDFYSRGQEKASEEKIQNLNRVLSKNPKDVNAYINRGVNYYRLRGKNLENLELAIQDYTKAIELSPKNKKAYVNRGIAYSTRAKQDQKDQEQAIEDYNQVINNIDPNYRPAYIGRGIAYSTQQKPKHQEAIRDYEKAIGIVFKDKDKDNDPKNNDANAYYALGFTLALQPGKEQEAIAAYEKAAELYKKEELDKASYLSSTRQRIQEIKAKLLSNQ